MTSCETDLLTTGLFDGEELLSAVRISTTLISITVVSAWFGGEKIKRLRLFFAHWLAGLVVGLASLVEDVMITNCWIGSNLVGFMKALKFFELSAFNMFALTNLAICVNLALIVSSQRTMSRVKSVSSPRLLAMFLAISMALAVPIIPWAETILIAGTGFFMLGANQRDNEYITVSFFWVEFFVGICMFFTVAWLLLFRLTEVKECWKIHARIRFYFGLTLVGIAVNLGMGICGSVNLASDDFIYLLVSWSWSFRYIHFALDTFVLYGVLQEKSLDERAAGRGIPRGSEGCSVDPSKSMTLTPPLV